MVAKQEELSEAFAKVFLGPEANNRNSVAAGGKKRRTEVT
jgi:hypothetical protein